MINASIQMLARFDPQRFSPVTLALTQHSKTMLVCFEPGQAIPIHSPGIDLTLLILEGRATLTADGEELTGAGPGAVMQVPAGRARGIKAEQRTLALVVVAPPPTDHDHREVTAQLKTDAARAS